ncbi:unnamed protein product, partial [Lampetra planeri]
RLAVKPLIAASSRLPFNRSFRDPGGISALLGDPRQDRGPAQTHQRIREDIHLEKR